MNRDQARTLICQTFMQAFDKARFHNFATNLLNHIDESKASAWNNQYVKDAFKDHVNRYERLGTYTSPDNEKLDVLIVHLTREYKLERARTAIRNFVADHLKTRDEKDAALVAFVSPTEKQWRFSYVRMEYASFEKSGKVGVETRLTPARRFSYIVGEGESCHTAQTRFLDLLQDTQTDPKLLDIEEAFSVEAVAKEFFTKYAELFNEIYAALEKMAAKDKTVRDEFKEKNIKTVDFAKKLMGQIVFLYFLQKKGWLGVAKGQDWGNGPRDFLRRLSNGEYGKYENFFNDILEPLFYDTLATDRGHEAWCSHFRCRIPFLNGGLFEPLNNYDWRKIDVILPNKLFTNSNYVDEGVIGTGVLDVFDRYNFTVNEAEPLEKEVAIDPEMLGKVFENLIEENRRKGLGAYYTPREIVHYMCQESLINYLYTALNTVEQPVAPIKPKQKKLFGKSEPEQTVLMTTARRKLVPREDIETFVQLGDQAAHYEAARMSGTKSYKPELPNSIATHARLIDNKLTEITVCDPAVGSGAFPVGMMTEIVRARSALTPYFNDVHERAPYFFKRHAIQNCLYGVDIDPGAVEIAKLRLWLSLVVDEEDVQQIKPLPNLDYKIVCGNSLLGVEKNLFNEKLFSELEKYKPLYFNETNPAKKQEYKKEIDGLIQEITKGHSEFDFEVYFSEIFHEKGAHSTGSGRGFDVVIANPPYLGQKGNKQVFQLLKRHTYWKPFYERKQDLYYYFIAKSIDLLSSRGSLTFIIPPYFLTASGASNLRKTIKQNTSIRKIINLSETVMVFESVSINNLILFLDKGDKDRKIEIIEPKGDKPSIQNFIEKSKSYFSQYSTATLSNEEWYIYKTAQDKNINLTRDMVYLGLIAQISPGIQTGCDTLTDKHIKKYNLKDHNKGEGIFVISDKEKDNMNLTKYETQFVKPFWKNSEIHKWYHNSQNNKWVIITNRIDDIDNCPNIKKHLMKYKKILDDRYRNYALINADKEGKWWYLYGYRPNTNFDDKKIILPYRSPRNTFAYCEVPFYSLMDVWYVNLLDGSFNEKFLCSILCSEFIYKWLLKNCKKKGRMFELIQKPLSTIPIRRISIDKQKPFMNLVDKILSVTQSDDYQQNAAKQARVKEYETQIDRLVYELYGLKEDESIIEGKATA